MDSSFEIRNDLKPIIHQLIDVFDDNSLSYADAIVCIDCLRKVITASGEVPNIEGHLIDKDKNGN